MTSWTSGPPGLPYRESSRVGFPRSTEAPSWPVKRDASTLPRTNATASTRSPTLASLPRAWPSALASSCAAASPTSPPTSRSPPNSAVTPTPSPAGGTGSPATASRACVTSRGVVARGLFPPEERHRVLALVTTRPADVGVPVSHWSLEDLAVKVLRDAHYRDMSRSTIQRLLAQA